MLPERIHPPRFRPSDSTPHRFYLWLCLNALGGAFLVFGTPYLLFVTLMLISLGGMAGRKLAEPGTGLKPAAFLAGIYLGAFTFLGVALMFYTASPSSQTAFNGAALPVWAKAVCSTVLVILLALELRRFLFHRSVVAA
jgi:hypothetical protein